MVEQLGQPYYSYVPEASPHLDWDTIRSHRLTSFHPFQRLSDLRLFDSPHKAPIGIIKRVIQLKGCVRILTIEQFIKILLPSMSDLILLHQEMLPFILNALNLVEVPCLSLTNPSHPINVLLSFLRTQMLVKILVRSTLCYTYSSLCSLWRSYDLEHNYIQSVV